MSGPGVTLSVTVAIINNKSLFPSDMIRTPFVSLLSCLTAGGVQTNLTVPNAQYLGALRPDDDSLLTRKLRSDNTPDDQHHADRLNIRHLAIKKCGIQR